MTLATAYKNNSDASVFSCAETIRQTIESGQLVIAGGRVYSQETALRACARIQEFVDAKNILASRLAPPFEKIYASKVLNRIYRRVAEAQALTAAQATAGCLQ